MILFNFFFYFGNHYIMLILHTLFAGTLLRVFGSNRRQRITLLLGRVVR